MCRSIKTLRGASGQSSEDDIRAASLQFVRKVSGYRTPSKANEAPFEAAVDEVSLAVRTLLASLAAPRNRAGRGDAAPER